MVDEGGEKLLDDLVARLQQHAFPAFGQLAARHAGDGIGHPGAFVLRAEVDLRSPDGQAGGQAFAFEGQGTAVVRIHVGHQDLAVIVGVDAGDLGPELHGVLGRAEPDDLYATGDAVLQHGRICQRIPSLVLGRRNPLGIGNAHGCLLTSFYLLWT
ncbi:hypothetical protein FQZ97_590780 [compost metagenome]